MTVDLKSFVRLTLVYVLLLASLYVPIVALSGFVNAGARLPSTHLPIREAPGQGMLAFRDAEKSGRIDVLFLGSSRAYRTFDPRFFDQFGLRTLNLGSSGQSPLNTYYVLPRYLVRLQPSVVVFEVWWITMRSTGVEGSLKLINNLPLSTDLLRMASATGEVRVLNSLVARTAAELVRPYRDWKPQLAIADTYTGRGFVEKDPSFEREAHWERQTVQLSPMQLDYLERLVTLLKECGIRVILVVPPAPAEALDSFENNEELDQLMNDWAREHVVPFIDFNKLPGLQRPAFFYDGTHLNQIGVATFLPVMYQEFCRRSLWDPLAARCDEAVPSAP